MFLYFYSIYIYLYLYSRMRVDLCNSMVYEQKKLETRNNLSFCLSLWDFIRFREDIFSHPLYLLFSLFFFVQHFPLHLTLNKHDNVWSRAFGKEFGFCLHDVYVCSSILSAGELESQEKDQFLLDSAGNAVPKPVQVCHPGHSILARCWIMMPDFGFQSCTLSNLVTDFGEFSMHLATV